MKRLIFLLVLFSLPLILSAQNINGRFSSSLYTFERYDVNEASQKYLRSYQLLNLNVNKGVVSLRSRLNLESNISEAMDYDPRLRFYNLYLEARNLFDIATVKLGRQPFFNGIAGGIYDGANLKLKYSDYKLTGFYGGNVPPYQKLEVTDSWEDDYVLGGKFETTALKDFRFVLSYVDKNYKAYSYSATRLDENLDPINVLIRQKSNQFKFASAEVHYDMEDVFDVHTTFDYDINFETPSKFEFSGSYDQIDKLGLNVYYNYREPRIRYNSIFAVFDYGNTQEIEAGIDYEISEELTAFGKFGNVIYEDETSERLTVGLNTDYGSASFRKTFGYAGELSSLSLYTAKTIMERVLTTSIGATYTAYKLSPDAELNEITSVFGGVNWKPWRVLSFDLQGQFFNNPIYKDDFRILFKINHWFNTNLDLI